MLVTFSPTRISNASSIAFDPSITSSLARFRWDHASPVINASLTGPSQSKTVIEHMGTVVVVMIVLVFVSVVVCPYA